MTTDELQKLREIAEEGTRQRLGISGLKAQQISEGFITLHNDYLSLLEQLEALQAEAASLKIDLLKLEASRAKDKK